MNEQEITTEQIAQNWVTWLNALISDEYRNKKGVVHLHRDDRYCCLGVACRVLDIHIEETVESYLAVNKALGLSANYPIDNTNEYIIIRLNDTTYEKDGDFINMHRELYNNMMILTGINPEVAPMVRKLLAQ
jgi:hypothetical protein